MGLSHLQGLSDQELTHRMFEVERELVDARFRHSAGRLENTAQLRTLRREIARIHTEARSREAAQGIANGALIREHRSSFRSEDAAPIEAPKETGGFLKGIVDKLTNKD